MRVERTDIQGRGNEGFEAAQQPELNEGRQVGCRIRIDANAEPSAERQAAVARTHQVIGASVLSFLLRGIDETEE